MSHTRIIVLGLVSSLGLWTACSGDDAPASGTDSNVAADTGPHFVSDSGTPTRNPPTTSPPQRRM
jgi:hypothetical protein